jgi:hypothetical protein
VRKQHLDTFAIAPGLLESLGLGEGASNVASIFVHIAHDPPRGHVRAAFWLERARTAVRQRCVVANPVIRADMPGGGHHFAGWADINVPFSVVPKVFPRKRPVLALRFVDYRDMRRNILLIDDP